MERMSSTSEMATSERAMRSTSGMTQTVVSAPSMMTPDTSDWRRGLPTMAGARVTVRELRVSDARSLCETLNSDEVGRYMSRPPTTVEAFERFIIWANELREAGEYLCFALVPHGMDTAIGLIQVRQLEPRFETAEWGFAMGPAYWGAGLFTDAARLVLQFAFSTVGVHRLEARATVQNGRGNGVLRKLGAVQEGVLRRALRRDDQYFDQMLWTILAEEWTDRSIGDTTRVH